MYYVSWHIGATYVTRNYFIKDVINICLFLPQFQFICFTFLVYCKEKDEPMQYGLNWLQHGLGGTDGMLLTSCIN